MNLACCSELATSENAVAPRADHLCHRLLGQDELGAAGQIVGLQQTSQTVCGLLEAAPRRLISAISSMESRLLRCAEARASRRSRALISRY
jgi:hypothetical protein